MTNITVYCKDNTYTGFRIEGHAGYADEGEDIICAGISVLAINFVNSIEGLTSDKFSQFEHEDDGIIDFEFTDTISNEAEILIKSLVLGLEQLEKEYKDFISLDYKEV
ncbi:MAG: ribosomal-processing cysteine protease Prp [Eubacterium sp.]|jgi:hypothetical protein|nr:ribosomal-processing cysteine protease Prp [Eubacterium sp.]